MTLTIVLLILATYRLAVMIAEDTGPWRIFESVRKVHDEKSLIHEALHCVGCVSVWISFILVAGAVYGGQVSIDTFPLVWLGVAGGAMFINRLAPCPR